MFSLPTMTIKIGLDPNMFEIGGLVLTWHGFLTFIAVALAVFLVGRWAKKEGMATDPVYAVATWAIIGGIVGTRVLHVIDLWNDVYRHDLLRIFQIYEGGITIYGAILGGFVGAAGYMLVRNHPRFLGLWNKVIVGVWNYLFVRLWKSNLFAMGNIERIPLPSIGRLADLTTPAILIAMAVGRIGDIINGEHVAKVTQLAWGFVYTHPESPSNQLHRATPSHPAVAYEMLWVLAVLAIIWPLRNRLRPPGMLFALYLALYSVGKFFVSYLRGGAPPMDKEWFIGITEAQVVAIIVLAITVPLLLLKGQLVRPAPARPAGSRSKR